MTALALALHTLGAVVWVGGMFAIYVCLRPALGTLEPPQRHRDGRGRNLQPIRQGRRNYSFTFALGFENRLQIVFFGNGDHREARL